MGGFRFLNIFLLCIAIDCVISASDAEVCVPIVRFVDSSQPQLTIDDSVKRLLNDQRKIAQAARVVTVVGPYRIGKSFLLNALFGSSNTFSVGHTSKPETLTFCAAAMPQTNLLFVDTPGVLSPISNEDRDARAVALAMATSSTILYFDDGVIDATAVHRLSLLAEYASSLGTSQRRDKPALVWVMRNSFLRLLSTTSGKDVSATQYVRETLEMATQSSSGEGERAMTDVFSSIHGFALPFPVVDTSKLSHLDVSSTSAEYQAAIAQLQSLLERTAVTRTTVVSNDDEQSVGTYISELEFWLAAVNNGDGLHFNSAEAIRAAYNDHIVRQAHAVYTSVLQDALVDEETGRPVRQQTLADALARAVNASHDYVAQHIFGAASLVDAAWQRAKQDISNTQAASQARYDLLVNDFLTQTVDKVMQQAESSMRERAFPMPEGELEEIYERVRDMALAEFAQHRFAEEFGVSNGDERLRGRLSQLLTSAERDNEKQSRAQCASTLRALASDVEAEWRLPLSDVAFNDAVTRQRRRFAHACHGPSQSAEKTRLDLLLEKAREQNVKSAQAQRARWLQPMPYVFVTCFSVAILAFFMAITTPLANSICRARLANLGMSASLADYCSEYARLTVSYGKSWLYLTLAGTLLGPVLAVLWMFLAQYVCVARITFGDIAELPYIGPFVGRIQAAFYVGMSSVLAMAQNAAKKLATPAREKRQKPGAKVRRVSVEYLLDEEDETDEPEGFLARLRNN